MTGCLSCGAAFRDVDLPLHDGGLEPVEFLKSMGISLTPLNEAAGYKKVRASREGGAQNLLPEDKPFLN